MKNKIAILILFLSVGCMGPPADMVNPDTPDNGNGKADPELVEEFRKAFGEFGKEDARKFGNYYLALSDLFKSKKLGVSNWNQFLKLTSKTTKAADVIPKNYPSFEGVLKEKINGYKPGLITDDQRMKFSKDFKSIGYSLLEAGKN